MWRVSLWHQQDLLSTQQGQVLGGGREQPPRIDPMEAACRDFLPNYQIVPRFPPAAGPASLVSQQAEH